MQGRPSQPVSTCRSAAGNAFTATVQLALFAEVHILPSPHCDILLQPACAHGRAARAPRLRAQCCCQLPGHRVHPCQEAGGYPCAGGPLDVVVIRTARQRVGLEVQQGRRARVTLGGQPEEV